MEEMFLRTAMLIGEQNLTKLKGANVAIFGVGGVGGYILEALVRCGVGAITIVDGDTVSLSNLNRQIIALRSTVGKAKVEVAKDRVLDINPECKVTALNTFYLPEVPFDFERYDYVIDAIDTVTAKIDVIVKCTLSGVKVISCMGTGNHLDVTKLKIGDIFSTSVCPLARVMRKELRARGVQSCKVLYSTEEPITPKLYCDEGKRTPASISFVPSVAGLMIAGEVIQDLIK